MSADWSQNRVTPCATPLVSRVHRAHAGASQDIWRSGLMMSRTRGYGVSHIQRFVQSYALFIVIADPTSMSWTFGTVCSKPLGSFVYFDTACGHIDSRRFFLAGMRGRAWELHIFTLSPTPGVTPHMVCINLSFMIQVTLMAHITAVGLVHCETK
jgi:hypothetical protein